MAGGMAGGMTGGIVRAGAAICAVVAFTMSALAGPQARATPLTPALWVVEDADSRIYLFGTIHMRGAGAPWGGEAAQAALAEAGEVWTELEIDPAKDAATGTLLVRFGMDPARRLSEAVDPARAPALSEALRAAGVPPATADRMRPWFAGLTIAMAPLLQAGYDPSSGVDTQIDAAAETAGKRMRWFETAEEQLSFLAGTSHEVALQMLYEALDEVAQGPQLMQAIEAAWEAGDDARLEEVLIKDVRTRYPELYDTLLKHRNQRWAEVLAREMAGSGIDFVAVGAAHLLGDDSVQAFLAGKGFHSRRIAP